MLTPFLGWGVSYLYLVVGAWLLRKAEERHGTDGVVACKSGYACVAEEEEDRILLPLRRSESESLQSFDWAGICGLSLFTRSIYFCPSKVHERLEGSKQFQSNLQKLS